MASKEDKAKAQELVDESINSIKSGNAQHALELLDKAITLDPENAFAWHARGNAKAAVGRHEDAIADYDKAIELHPNKRFLLNRGFSKGKIELQKLHKGETPDYESFVGDFILASPINFGIKASTGQDRKYAEELLLNAEDHFKQNQYLEAMVAATNALHTWPMISKAWLLRARVMDKFDHSDAAILEIEQAIKYSPDEAIYYSYKGYLHSKYREYETALLSADKALEIEPKNEKFILQRINLLISLERDIEECLITLDQIISEKPSFYLAIEYRATCFRLLGKFNAAIEDLKKIIDLLPNNENTAFHKARALHDIGYCYGMLNQYEMAIEYYSKALDINPSLHDTLHNRSLVKIKIQDYQGAKTDLIEYCKLKQPTASIRLDIAACHRNLGEYDEAIAIYDSLERYRSNSALFINRGMCRTDAGQYEKAHADYDKAISLKKNLSIAWANKGVTYALQKKIKKAEESFRKSLEIDPKNSHALINYSMLLLELNRVGEVQEKLDKAIFIEEDNHSLWYAKATLNLQAKNFGTALHDIDKALKIKPEDSLAILIKGQIFIGLDKLDDALSCFNQYNEQRPDDTLAFFYIGLIQLHKQQYRDSVLSFSKHLEDYEDNTQAYIFRAQANLNLDKIENAKKDVEKLKSLGADNADLEILQTKILDGQNSISNKVQDSKSLREKILSKENAIFTLGIIVKEAIKIILSFLKEGNN